MAHLPNLEIKQLQTAVGRLIDEVAELKRGNVLETIQRVQLEPGDVVFIGVKEEIPSSSVHSFAEHIQKALPQNKIILHRGELNPKVMGSASWREHQALAVQRYRLLSVLAQAPEDNFMRDLTAL